MSDPPRLTRLPNGGLGATLIESARDDAPPKAARQRALLAVGAGGGALLAAGAAKGAALAAGATAGGSAGSAGTSTGTAVAWGAIGKWIGGGAVAAVVTAGAITKLDMAHPFARPNVTMTARRSPADDVPSPAPARTRRSASPARPEPAFEPALTPPALEPAPAPALAPEPAPAFALEGAASPPHILPPPREPARHRLSPAKVAAREPNTEPTSEIATRHPTPPATLVDEIAALDRAREAVAGGSSDRAMAALDDYDRRFAGGTLSLESQVLRVEALAQKGDAEKAARLAEAFLAQHPSSAHTARVRSLLVSIRKDRAP